VDGVRGGVLERLQLLGGEHHVLALRELVALRHLGALDQRAVVDRDVLLFDARTVALAKQVEGHALARAGGRVELDRDRDEAERDRERSDGAGIARHGVTEGRRLSGRPLYRGRRQVLQAIDNKYFFLRRNRRSRDVLRRPR